MKCSVLPEHVNIVLVVIMLSCSGVCTVDLQNAEGLSLQITKKNLDTFCELGMNAVVQEKIVVPQGSKADLTFLDCPTEDLVLTATKTMGNHYYHYDPLIWFQLRVKVCVYMLCL